MGYRVWNFRGGGRGEEKKRERLEGEERKGEEIL